MNGGSVLRARDRAHPGGQRGIVMWVALVVLIVMTLAGLAMLRQMGTGVSIAGNMAFKQNATSVADLGTEAARLWVMAPTTDTTVTQAPAGYYATWAASVDPTTFDWTNVGSVLVTPDDGTGNEVRYVVHRLCQSPGAVTAPAQHCSDLEDKTGGSKGGLGYGSPPPAERFRAYFNLTVRVRGPRNTLSYTQVVME
jgi:type IV pilus assembly protein PilX